MVSGLSCLQFLVKETKTKNYFQENTIPYQTFPTQSKLGDMEPAASAAELRHKKRPGTAGSEASAGKKLNHNLLSTMMTTT